MEEPVNEAAAAPVTEAVAAPQTVAPVAPTSVAPQAFASPEQLLGELSDKVDYEPQSVVAYMNEHKDAARFLLPALVNKNKDLADQFIDANIDNAELQEIYNQAISAGSNTMSL